MTAVILGLPDEKLKREWPEAEKTNKFGLAFDRHLPELVPIPKARPTRGGGTRLPAFRHLPNPRVAITISELRYRVSRRLPRHARKGPRYRGFFWSQAPAVVLAGSVSQMGRWPIFCLRRRHPPMRRPSLVRRSDASPR